MTKVYFVRHAFPDKNVHDDRIRPLTEDGLRDSKAVTWALKDKNIDILISSPYKRSIDTIADLAQTLGMEIRTDDDLRERGAGKWLGENFFEFIKAQWADFNYHIMDGECLADVQKRNIRALNKILDEHENKNIVIATHGTAMSTILNYYYPEFGFEQFMKIVNFMPFVIRLDFEGIKCKSAQVELVIRKD